MKNFVIIGAGGYIAPRHMKAIKDTNNNLLAALDKHDSVGILDSYFPDADFFTEFERFDRHIEKLRRQGVHTDYVTVCSPNYLHDAHIRFGLRIGADIICEKPIVLNPWNIDALMEIERETNHRVYGIFQLRYHPNIIKLKEEISATKLKQKYEVSIHYVTSRGNWYKYSWKGDDQKSGGIVTNIGIHFFDILVWLFGDPIKSEVGLIEEKTAFGKLEFDNANISWYLSTDQNELSENARHSGKKIERRFEINGQNIPFNDEFENLHTRAYWEILNGNGIGLGEAKRSIEIVNKIKNAQA